MLQILCNTFKAVANTSVITVSFMYPDSIRKLVEIHLIQFSAISVGLIQIIATMLLLPNHKVFALFKY